MPDRAISSRYGNANQMLRQRPIILAVLSLALLLAGCGSEDDGQNDSDELVAAGSPTPAAVALGPLPTGVPPIPFSDNPDPEACGIPRQWGKDDPAWLTGEYEGELVQPVVYLYDSHLRDQVVGQVPHGGRVRVILYQSNPVLDYYMVRSLDLDTPQEGWVPAPFLSFEPVGQGR